MIVITRLLPNLTVLKLIHRVSRPAVEIAINPCFDRGITSLSTLLLREQHEGVAHKPTIKSFSLGRRESYNPSTFQLLGRHDLIHCEFLLTDDGNDHSGKYSS